MDLDKLSRFKKIKISGKNLLQKYNPISKYFQCFKSPYCRHLGMWLNYVSVEIKSEFYWETKIRCLIMFQAKTMRIVSIHINL